MTSEARQTANAANALLSTGPRTNEGKARSSQNARQHGLTAAQVVIAAEDRDEFCTPNSKPTSAHKAHSNKFCSTSLSPLPGISDASAAWKRN